jgi:hypothetical protein
MRISQERLTAFSAFAALALGAAGMVFERAGTSVLSAGPEEFASWARAHDRELVAQSLFLSLGTAPLLVFFLGLHAYLEGHRLRRGLSRVDLTLVVLAGGASWVVLNLLGQALQVSMARAAGGGAATEVVVSRGDRMLDVLTWGNLALGAALGATAFIALRSRALPGWLGWLSALGAVAHVAPVAGRGVEEGPLSRDGVLAYLPYPVFVGWMVSVAVTLLRKDTENRSQPLRSSRLLRALGTR